MLRVDVEAKAVHIWKELQVEPDAAAYCWWVNGGNRTSVCHNLQVESAVKVVGRGWRWRSGLQGGGLGCSWLPESAGGGRGASCWQMLQACLGHTCRWSNLLQLYARISGDCSGC